MPDTQPLPDRLPPADRPPLRGRSNGGFPADWPAISRAAKQAAGGCCTGGVLTPSCRARHGSPDRLTGQPVALTLVHLNGWPHDVSPRNLRVWCQSCHREWWPLREDPAYWIESDMPMARFVHHLMAIPDLDELSGFVEGFRIQRLRLTVSQAEALQDRMHDLMRAAAPKYRPKPRRK